jgi:hypothetical protein
MHATATAPLLHQLPDRLYYLRNFQRLLEWIERRYGDLLQPPQLHFIVAFRRLPQPSQALLTRMAMRKSDVFRARTLQYEEIGPLPVAMQPLVAAELVEEAPALGVEELFALLTKPELLRMFRWPRGAAQLPKSALLDMQRSVSTEARTPEGWGAPEQVYRLRAAALCERLRLMYFGNFHQTWSEFVLADMGVFQYETVPFTPQARAFHTAGQIESFHQLYRCRERLHADHPPADVLRDLPAAVAGSAWIEQRRQKLLHRVAQRFESLRQPDRALDIYRTCEHPGSLLRAALILERSDAAAAARDCCLEGLGLAREAAFHPRLQRVLRRLEHKTGGVRPRRAPPRSEVSTLTIAPPAAEERVEDAAAVHLAAAEPDSRVIYVENLLINSLFGLLCWDAVFAPLPGAFFHPYQHGPADLLAPDFHARRREMFDACLDALRSGAHQRIIRERFEQKQGLQSPFVHWGALDADLLDLALHCIPASHLQAWFEWILRDVGANSAGFPDLAQFWPAQQRYRFIEIKGPGDHLQENQRRMLDYAAGRGLPVAVIHVKWAAAATLP